MKWSEVVALIDPAYTEVGDYYISPVWGGDVQRFAEVLEVPDLYYCEEFSKRMLKHWVQSWVCTDTRVGVAVYCLDGEVAAVSNQPARKSDEVLTFVSAEMAMRITQLLIELREKQQGPNNPSYTVASMDDDAPSYSNFGNYYFDITGGVK